MNSPELLSTSLGQGGSTFDSGTTGVSGKWKLLYAVTSSVIAAIDIQNMTGSLAGVTLAQGTTIGGDIRAVRLTSGSVVLYE